MRILTLSDIHNKIDRVKLLREREANVFDAIICAGDIGSDIAAEFYKIMDTFECPCFCVYGNWDHELPYKRKLSKNCRLIHHSVHHVGKYYISGYSGCPYNQLRPEP